MLHAWQCVVARDPGDDSRQCSGTRIDSGTAAQREALSRRRAPAVPSGPAAAAGPAPPSALLGALRAAAIAASARLPAAPAAGAVPLSLRQPSSAWRHCAVAMASSMERRGDSPGRPFSAAAAPAAPAGKHQWYNFVY